MSFAATSARRPSAPAIRASSSAATSPAFSSRSISARQRSACSSTLSIVPPCFRFRRSNASRRSSTASRRPGSAVDPVEVAAQVARRIVELERRRPHAFRERIQLGVDAGRGVEARLGLGQRRACAAVLVGAADRRERPGRPGAQPLGVSQEPALGLERRPLVGIRRRGVDLGELEAHQVQVALATALALAQLGELARERHRLAVGLAVGLAQPQQRRAARAVEDLELRRGEHQAPVLVLAVEREQP